jgi:hypothetical protein
LATGGSARSSPGASRVDVFHLGFSPGRVSGGDIARKLGLPSSPGPKKELVKRGVTLALCE